jgi:uncharacterized protein YbjT (DUF2867 family)
MQNVMMAAPTVRDHGCLYFDWGNGKAGIIDSRDVVDCSVGALTGQATAIQGQTFVLTGPAAIGLADVAAILSDVTGRTVQYVPVPHQAAVDAMIAMGVPPWIAEGYAEIHAGLEDGFADLTTSNVHALSGHQPRGFEQFARDFADVFTPAPVAAAAPPTS